ncbi:MAG: endonuclease III [Planctomycetes bacterium]|nr:endonuclease III [Planctomycetota bacterium]
MKLAEKARRIQEVLDRLYPEPAVPLDHQDPYTLLIAVLLSAQCTDKRVNRTTPALFALARTPESMARLTADEVREIIKPCGLSPAKSKAIVGLSKILVERFGGRVPETFEELESLPGVGHKTASVVMSHAFKQLAFPVDTHIHRLAHRWGLSDGSSVERTERDLKQLFPEQDWERLHLQIIYFGREHCPALRHVPAQCPICSWAAARAGIPAPAPGSGPAPARAAPKRAIRRRAKAAGAPAARQPQRRRAARAQ